MRAFLPGVFVAVSLAAGCANGGDPSMSLGPTPVSEPPGLGGSSSSGSSGGPSNAPAFPPTLTARVPPPPISGGTLVVALDGTFAVAADSDRDAVYGIDLETREVVYTVALQ